jgi:hypothetical protein
MRTSTQSPSEARPQQRQVQRKHTHVSAIFPSSAYACCTILDTATPSGTCPTNVFGSASSSSRSCTGLITSILSLLPPSTPGPTPPPFNGPLPTPLFVLWMGLAALLLVLSRWIRIFRGWDGAERCSGSCITIHRGDWRELAQGTVETRRISAEAPSSVIYLVRWER